MEPLNFVFIMSDEHSARTLGCCGHEIVKTPHIDALAASGTRFTAAYTNCPICVPARASFATGRYAHETGYWDNAHPYDGRIPGWGHRLQATGHKVVSIGKLHYRNMDDPTGLDAQILPMHVKDGRGDLAGALRAEMPPKTATKGLAEQLGPGDSSVLRYDRQIAERACKWIEEAGGRDGERPWMLFVSFLAPHYPLAPPPEFYAMYPAEEMPLPPPKSADDPLAFRPERWTSGLCGALPRCVYIPFGASPHDCIGGDFASMTATIVLAFLAGAYACGRKPAMKPKY